VLTATSIRSTTLPSDEIVPVLGLGTWGLAEGKHPREGELRALRTGLDFGMSLIDTAEMYADGRAEELVADAIHGRRDEVFLVSKVLPEHATKTGTIAACERSLRRLKTHRLDLYLLHWREKVPLEETLAGFDALIEVGKIRYWGVSNFDLSDMEELVGLPGGDRVATNQVLYNLARRGIEYDLLPWCLQRKIPIMAYSPIEQGRLLNRPELQAVARRHHASPAQVALAWVLRKERLIAIPKAGLPEHVRQNYTALNLRLSEQELSELDRAFPPPTEPRPLETL
jgi:diketogulonate reductase-like aldo/keto reductase